MAGILLRLESSQCGNEQSTAQVSFVPVLVYRQGNRMRHASLLWDDARLCFPCDLFDQSTGRILMP